MYYTKPKCGNIIELIVNPIPQMVSQDWEGKQQEFCLVTIQMVVPPQVEGNTDNVQFIDTDEFQPLLSITRSTAV